MSRAQPLALSIQRVLASFESGKPVTPIPSGGSSPLRTGGLIPHHYRSSGEWRRIQVRESASNRPNGPGSHIYFIDFVGPADSSCILSRTRPYGRLSQEGQSRSRCNQQRCQAPSATLSCRCHRVTRSRQTMGKPTTHSLPGRWTSGPHGHTSPGFHSSPFSRSPKLAKSEVDHDSKPQFGKLE
jgi:hypothetical protein